MGREKNLHDLDGKPYRMPEWHLPPKEYGEVVNAIDDAYHIRYANKPTGHVQTPKHIYDFEIHGYNKYNIYKKR